MARKEAKLNCISFVQEFEREYWNNWSDAELSVLEDVRQGRRGIESLVDIIRKRLEAAGMQLEEMYAIIHDKDKDEKWSDVDGRFRLVDKKIHIHGVVKFKKDKGGTIDAIAKAIGLEPQYVEKAKKGKYAYDNMVSYLIHVKYENKYQYNPSEVYTAVGREYKSYCAERMADWLKGRASIKCKEAAEGIDDLEEKILQGVVTRTQVLSDSKLYAIYARNRRRCDEAFDTYSDRKAVLTEQASLKGDFKLTVFFVYGDAGAGKTIIANQLIDRVIKRMSAERNERWTCYKTAATNPMDKYNGSEIILMDDVRGGCMLAEDWLHLIDNHNITDASARYHNKLVAPRLLIITNVHPPITFFSYCKQPENGSAEEPFDQFLRRIQSLVHVMSTNVDNEPVVSISNCYCGTPYTEYIPFLNKSVKLNYSFPPTEYQAVQTSLDLLEKTVMFNNLPKAERERIQLEWIEKCTEMWGAPPNVLQEWALIPAPDEDYVSNMTDADALAVARASLLPTVPIGINELTAQSFRVQAEQPFATFR